MPTPNYTSVLLGRWKTIAAFAFAGLLLALVISIVQPLRYSSTIRLLVLQDTGSAVDAYTASRSEERIAENLSNIIYTTTFFEDVMNAGFSIDSKVFPSEDYKRRRAWGKAMGATVARGSGLLTISAYHQNPDQAEQIVRAVAFVLTENANEYVSGANIDIKLIDAPLNSRYPVRPNIPANLLSGLVLGGLMGVALAVGQYETIRRRHQLVHEG